MHITFDKKIPCNIIKLAFDIMVKVENKEIRPKRLTSNKSLVVNIGLKYRAIQLGGSGKWFICSHEKYNRLSLKKL